MKTNKLLHIANGIYINGSQKDQSFNLKKW
jgi:hypothetical protein